MIWMCILDYVRKEFNDALKRRCYERSCKLKLDGLSNCVVLDGERLRRDKRLRSYVNKKICDCIIFAEGDDIGNVIGIIELKSKVVHCGDVVKKFVNGTELVSKILKGAGVSIARFQLYHIVLAKSWNGSEFRMMGFKGKIMFEGRKYHVIPKSCGESFLNVIENFKA